MPKVKEILERESYSKNDIACLLSRCNEDEIQMIRRKALEVMKANVGEEVSLRGLIEFSNICTCDCLYCGIRKSNRRIRRYLLSKEEILHQALVCAQRGYGSIVLQSGERRDQWFVEFVGDVVRSIKERTVSEQCPHGLGITLCVGEQTPAVYERFFRAGAHRYLLRIETTSDTLFKRLHPARQSLEERKRCLGFLKEIGYQVGTGVMIGLPGQSYDMLADDVLFFKEYDIDMIGMGPYIIQKDTPLSFHEDEMRKRHDEEFLTALKMIAVTRLVLRDVNIAATTALQAMEPDGREQGLLYGANVIMPQFTPCSVRRDYLLYEGRPNAYESEADDGVRLAAALRSIGRKVGLDSWGDSPHFFVRTKRDELPQEA